jgi:NAD+ synthase (glutamine-hydrolysing)
MRTVRVGVASLNQTPLDWKGNRERIERALDESRRAEVRILVLPELAITGYGCEDMFHSPALLERAKRTLVELLPRTTGMVTVLGLPLAFRGAVFNTVALVANGQLHGFVAKTHLAGDGLHYEPRWFESWASEAVSTVEIAGQAVPIGDPVFTLGDVTIGVEICEDAWAAERRGARAAALGADVILNPSASHFSFGKQAIRRRLALEGSRAYGVTYLAANLMGNEAGRAIYDGGGLIVSSGRIVAEGPRLSLCEVALTHATVDLDLDRIATMRTISHRPHMTKTDRVVTTGFAVPRDESPVSEPQDTPRFPETKEEEFARAIALGLFDYLRKSRSRGYVVSLSGGADSAACACLVALMVRLGIEELGLDEFKARLSHVEPVQRAKDEAEVVRALLITAYQSTRHSGEVTRSAARGVAEAIGATHHELDVEPMFQAYVEAIERVEGRTLRFPDDDLALQNVQARVRSPSVWLLANLKGAILLSTSNRSEAAVGYATMDGDTSGGLSPIAGIDKAFLRVWLAWLETEGPQGGFRVPALAAVNAQIPTAELRPPEAGQTDEADLMPYPLLDAIERHAIRDKRSPKECYEALRPHFPELDDETLRVYVRRFFTLFAINQWKRERYAPSFHVDDKNLDPKTWCRFPILNGAFAAELDEL